MPGGTLHNWPRRRLWLSAVANWYVRAVTGLRIRDCTSGFRCWSRDLLARLPLAEIASDGYAFQVEMAFEAQRAGAHDRRSADHVRRAAPGLVQAVVERHRRVDLDAVAPGCAAGRPEGGQLNTAHRRALILVYPPRPMPSSGSPRPSISAFFPCYNDESTIAGLVREADAQLRCATDDYEIIVVNDGSRDGSAAVLAELAQQMPRLKVVTHDVNRGYGGALRSGFAAATKELVFYTDGDGQYDVGEIPIMLALLVDDTDFVNGMKMSRSDPTYRVFVGNLHKFVTRWAFWLPIDDVDCDYRLMRRSVLEQRRAAAATAGRSASSS